MYGMNENEGRYDPIMSEESPVALDLVREVAARLDAVRNNLNWRDMSNHDRRYFSQTQILLMDIIGDHEAKEIEPGEEPEPLVDEDKMKARQHE